MMSLEIILTQYILGMISASKRGIPFSAFSQAFHGMIFVGGLVTHVGMGLLDDWLIIRGKWLITIYDILFNIIIMVDLW